MRGHSGAGKEDGGAVAVQATSVNLLPAHRANCYKTLAEQEDGLAMPMWQAPAPFSRRKESDKKCFEVRNHRQTDLFHSRSFFTDDGFAVSIHG